MKETSEEFYRRRSKELAPNGITKRLASIVDISMQVQIMEEYVDMQNKVLGKIIKQIDNDNKEKS